MSFTYATVDLELTDGVYLPYQVDTASLSRASIVPMNKTLKVRKLRNYAKTARYHEYRLVASY